MKRTSGSCWRHCRAHASDPRTSTRAHSISWRCCSPSHRSTMRRRISFIAKWQQLTPAVMAKGVEDTTFYYCFDRLVSCNEVGSQASLIGISADKFHEFCHYLSDRWPNSMLATSTHDNKRSEDVRARISILSSEIPERWSEALHLWSQLKRQCLAESIAGSSCRIPAVPDTDWCVAHRSRSNLGLHAQSMPRGKKSTTSWHEPNNSFEEKNSRFRGRRIRHAGVSSRASNVSLSR